VDVIYAAISQCRVESASHSARYATQRAGTYARVLLPRDDTGSSFLVKAIFSAHDGPVETLHSGQTMNFASKGDTWRWRG
jgi:hypothetical protein